MLNKYESEVMSAVYDLCDGTEGCLVSLPEIMSLLPSRRQYTRERLEEIMYGLKCDGYFEMISSERKGERMYVINLKDSGFAFKRAEKQRRREALYKIGLAFIGAAATFLFGLILKGIFG